MYKLMLEMENKDIWDIKYLSTLNELIHWADSMRIAYLQTGELPSKVNTWLMDIIEQFLPKESYRCNEVLLTNNPDKPPFWIYFYLDFCDENIAIVLFDHETRPEDIVGIKRFSMELDSHLFDGRFDAEEIAFLILYYMAEILSPSIYSKIRLAIDAALVDNIYVGPRDRFIQIEQAQQRAMVFRYAFTCFINQMATFSCQQNAEELAIFYNNLFGGAPMLQVEYVQGILASLSDKFGVTKYEQHPAVQVMDWLIAFISNPEEHMLDALDTLNSIIKWSGSEYEKKQAKQCIDAIYSEGRASGEKIEAHRSIHMEAFLEMANSVSEGFSLFKSIKLNGLRTIEDDLYEYRIRIKNCEEEDEAMYILRQINTRIGILDDYIRNTNLTDYDKKHWHQVMEQYYMLRVELGKKKLGPKKQYGIFVDYDKLDQLD